MLEKLYKSRYAGPLEGLEDCLPKFRHRDIILYDGRPRTGGGGGRRRSSRYGNPLQKKLEAWYRRKAY
ncbi:MAG: hypothetical protein ACPL5F_12155 [Moorellaceae bacterium]